MNTLKFKTNINCGSCVAKVSPVLNSNLDISTWNVDTDNPNKILTVETELEANQIKKILAEVGYQAEALNVA